MVAKIMAKTKVKAIVNKVRLLPISRHRTAIVATQGI